MERGDSGGVCVCGGGGSVCVWKGGGSVAVCVWRMGAVCVCGRGGGGGRGGVEMGWGARGCSGTRAEL